MTVGSVREFGNLLKFTFKDGSEALAYPSNGSYYIMGTNSWGIINVLVDDKQLILYFYNNTTTIGTRTASGIWILNEGTNSGTPGTSGGTPTPGPWEWPMDTSKWSISSPYGPRTSPYTGFHYGIDITGSGVTGKPIWAIGAGTVILNDYNSRAGYWCIIAHPDGTRTQYMHFPTYGPVPVGATVVKGQLIGNVGATGDSTGAHLHFQTQDTSNTAMDPILYMRARGHEFGEVQPT